MKENNNFPSEDELYSIARIGHWYLNFENQTSSLDDVTCSILEVPLNTTTTLDHSKIFYVNDADHQRINSKLRDIMQSGGAFSEEVQLQTPKKNIIWVMLAASAEMIDGKCKMIKGLTLDITNQKKLQVELSNSNQLFNVAQEKAQLGHWLWDASTKLATCSDNMCELLGIEKGSAVPLETILKDVHPDDMEDVQASLAISMQTKVYKSFTHRIVLKGHVRYIKVIGEVNTDEQGNIVNVLGISQDITEQKNFENEILRKNHLLNVAEQKAHMGHWYWQDQTDYILGSWNLFRLFGIEFEDEKVPIKSLLKFVHPKDLKRVDDYRLRALKERKLDQLVFRIILGNNEIRTLMVTGEVYEDKDSGRIKEILGIFQDITEQKTFETEILKKNNLLNLAEEKALMGHWHLKLGNRYTTWSNNLLAMYGMDIKDSKVSFEDMLSYVHPDDKKILLEHRKTGDRTGTFEDFIHRIILKDGTEKTLKINQTVYTNENDEAEEVIGVCQDITLQFKEEAKIRNILDSAPYPKLILNKEGIIEMVNNEAQRMFGYSSKELIGQNIKLLIPERFYNSGMLLREDFFENPRIVSVNVDEQLFMISKKGKEIPVEVTVGPVFTNEGVLGAWVARDVTKEKEDEQKILTSKKELEALTDELKAQNHQLEDFSHITTHNLRAPVNNLNALLSLYKIAKSEGEKGILFEKFEKVIDHLTLTLDTLVDTLRVQTETMVTLKDLSFSNVLTKTQEILTAEIERTGATISADFSQIDSMVYNPIYMDSIFQNLIGNALKYKHPDRKPVIEITSKIKDNRIHLIFKDNGLGMNLERYGDKLFKMNKVFHKHPEAKGVGLYMTKTQIESLGGKISAKSKVNKGSTFTVEFAQEKKS